jgi:hypothetical protein
MRLLRASQPQTTIFAMMMLSRGRPAPFTGRRSDSPEIHFRAALVNDGARVRSADRRERHPLGDEVAELPSSARQSGCDAPPSASRGHLSITMTVIVWRIPPRGMENSQ